MIKNTVMIDYAPDQSTALLARILSLPESRGLDFKRVSGKMVQKALETICAFANTDGGVLALGIEDPAKADGAQRVYGVQENLEAIDELQRKARSQFRAPIEGIVFVRLACTLRDGQAGHVVLVHVDQSPAVHSVVDDGTWTRLEASNREMSAPEITDLSYQRGVKSAETLPMPVALNLLDSATWRSYCATRGLADFDLATRLPKLGLAVQTAGALQPLLAAVLLFADEPGGLLAGQGMRSDIRVFHYQGRAVQHGEVPNLLLPPKTISGPVVEQIAKAQAYVLERLAQGLTMEGSGFKTRYRFPPRVIKEAVTNAVVHRDYRLNRDIHIRIFDDRVEVESPGRLPGNLTPATVDTAGSMPRNSALARHLREFPNPPNVDAGEGVPMMFAQMAQANLYEPLYREQLDAAVPTLLVTLLNEERPPLWVQVSDWVERNGPIANADVCRIADVDTLKASKMLRAWADRGLLEPLPGRVRSNAAYRKPSQVDAQLGLLRAPVNGTPPPQ